MTIAPRFDITGGGNPTGATMTEHHQPRVPKQGVPDSNYAPHTVPPSTQNARPIASEGPSVGDPLSLAGASLGQPPLDTIMQRYAPAELSLEGVTLEDACRVINEELLPNEDFSLAPDELGRFLEQTARGQALDRTQLADLSPQGMDLFIRQLITLRGAERQLSEEAGVEFSINDPNHDGCVVTVTAGSSPQTCRLTIDWSGELSYQSNYSLQARWERVQEVLLVAGEIDTASCKTRAIDLLARRFQLEERATLEVVARDLQTAVPSQDPHLSQRRDLLPLCALRVLPEEEDSLTDLQVRYVQIYSQLGKITAGLETKVDFDAAKIARSHLDQLGEMPYLWNSPVETALIMVEDYILVVTQASTGLTLLEDLAALERYRRNSTEGTQEPTIDALRSIQATDPSPDGLAAIFKKTALPNKDYFVEAMRDFVEDDSPTARQRIKDGLLDAIIQNKPASVVLAREFQVAGCEFDITADLDDVPPGPEISMEEEDLAAAEGEETRAGDEPNGEPADESAAMGGEPEEESPEDMVTVSRTAFAAPRSGRALSDGPVIGFFAGEKHENGDSSSHHPKPTLSITVETSQIEEPFLPVDFATESIRSLGGDPSDLAPLATVTNPTLGERQVYISESVSVIC